MEIQLERSNAYSLTTAALTPMVLGKERIEMYEKNRFPIHLVIEFFKGTLKPQKMQGVFANLIGYEFNTILLQYLKSIGATNIQSEVDITTTLGNTSVDAIATLLGIENSFEAKATKKLPKKTILQIRKAKTIYPVANVFVCSNTKIPIDISKQLKKEDANVVRSVLSRNDIVKRLLSLQKAFRTIN